MMMGGMSLGMDFWGLTTMLLFWAILVVAAVWLVGLLFPAAHPHDHQDHPNSGKK
jgi:hypothetical protein